MELGWKAIRPSAPRVGVAISVLILVTILAPIGTVLVGSLWSAPFIKQPGSFSLVHYITFLTSPDSRILLLATLEMTLGSAALAMAVGGSLAWVVTRTDVPLRRFIWWMPMASLFLPGLLRDIAWIDLYSPRVGLANLILMRLTGTSTPIFDIFSMAGVIVDLGSGLAPIPYLILLGPLSSMDRGVEEASRASGAGSFRTLRDVTIPLLRPALLSGLTLTAIISAEAFETPVIVGLPGGVRTFMSAIYTSMSSLGTTPNYDLASAQAVVYLALIGVLLLWYRNSTSLEGRFALIAGRGNAPARTNTGPWRYLLLVAVIVHFVVAFGQLFAITVYVSLVPYYSLTDTGPGPALTLENYQSALGAVGASGSIVSSFLVAAEVSVLCVAASTVLALVAFKTRVRGRRLAEIIGTLPIAFPPLVFSVIVLITFLSIPGMASFYNTIALLLVAEVIVFLPYGLRVISSSVISIDDQLIEASASSGASTLRTIRSIVLPLLGTALVNALTIVFILSIRELGAVALVVPPGMDLIPTQIFQLWQAGAYGAVNAFNIVFVMLSVVVLVATRGVAYLVARAVAHGQELREDAPTFTSSSAMRSEADP